VPNLEIAFDLIKKSEAPKSLSDLYVKNPTNLFIQYEHKLVEHLKPDWMEGTVIQIRLADRYI
jgi:hypothetical protein